MPKVHIRKGDMVVALTGADAGGKTGKVLQVMPGSGKAIVEGFNYVTKHMRKSQDNPEGGVVRKEAPMFISKLRVKEPGEARKKDRWTRDR